MKKWLIEIRQYMNDVRYNMWEAILWLCITHVSVDGRAESPLVDAGAVVESEQRLEQRTGEDVLKQRLSKPSDRRKITQSCGITTFQ